MNYDKTNDKYELHVINRCNYMIVYKKKLLYFSELFENDMDYYKIFLNNIHVDGKIDKFSKNKISVYSATGKNKILMICRDNYTEMLYKSNGVFDYYNINKKLVDKLYDFFGIDKIITDNFLHKYFVEYKNNNVLNNKYFYLVPDIYKSNIEQHTIWEIIKTNQYNKKIQDIVFSVIVKCEDYNDILSMYNSYDNIDNKNNDYIKKKIWSSRYKNVFYLNKNDLNLFVNIRNKIIEYFKKIGIEKENILIIIDMLNVNYMWLNIRVYIRNIFKGEYITFNTSAFLRYIEIGELIKILSICDGDVSKEIDNRYYIFISTNDIKEYINKLDGGEFNNGVSWINNVLDKIKPVDENISYGILNNNTKIDIPKSTKKNNMDVFYGDIFKNINIIRLLNNKDTQFISFCQKTICCEINKDYFIVNIIPKTAEYIKYIYENNGNVLEYLLDINAYNNIELKKIQYINHSSLKYFLEMVKITPYNCSGYIKNSITLDKVFKNIYIQKYIPLLIKRLPIKFKETYTISQSLIECYKETFVMKMFVFVYNILRLIIIYYRQNYIENNISHNDKLLNKCIILIDKILKLENEFDTIQRNNIINENILNGKKELSKEEEYKLFYWFHNIFGNKYKQHDFYFNGPFYVNYNTNYTYIGVPDLPYINHPSDKNFRVIIWYTPCNMYSSYNIIHGYITKLENMKDTFVPSSTKYRSFDVIELSESNINGIFGELYTKNMKQRYLYNISSLYTKDFKKQYYFLYNFINDMMIHKYKKKYYYSTYHYPTAATFSTLHIHILLVYSVFDKQGNSFTSSKTLGPYGTYVYEYYNDYAIDYNKLNKYWINKHDVMFTIANIDLFIKKIINDKTISLFEKNNTYVFDSDNINKLIEFMYEYIYNKYIHSRLDIRTESINLAKKYLKELLSFNDYENAKTFVNHIKLLIKYNST
jgi:hypothetical protein